MGFGVRKKLKQPRYRMTPFTEEELALIFGVVPITGLAIVLMEVQWLNALSKRTLAVVLDEVCAWSVPTFWCRVPRPVPSSAVVQALNYVFFLGASVYLVLRIFRGKYDMPAHYSPGAAPRLHQWVWALLWFNLVMGGQLIVQGPIPWETVGLLFMMLALGTGICAVRFLAVSVKFSR